MVAHLFLSYRNRRRHHLLLYAQRSFNAIVASQAITNAYREHRPATTEVQDSKQWLFDVESECATFPLDAAGCETTNCSLCYLE
jgi:hypothetical protein